MKEYILIAGPNGAGKSTLYNISNSFSEYKYINPDRLALKSTKASETGRMAEAAETAIRMIHQSLTDGESLVQETTLCGRTILKNIQRAKEGGYKIVIHFIGIDSVDLAKERIKRRVAGGGHRIPDKDIERRYEGAFERIKELTISADEVYLYDNTERLTRIAKFANGKRVWKSGHIPKYYIKYFGRKAFQ